MPPAGRVRRKDPRKLARGAWGSNWEVKLAPFWRDRSGPDAQARDIRRPRRVNAWGFLFVGVVVVVAVVAVVVVAVVR
jgi:hypothetical protein